ncbi:Fe-S cluster assembly iron-binding protein IscA [Tamaricihabitans halophyticus]|uniref:Fe-S cluster assembly iron-binding protein IscA n=1 Tax=Tamaricihabitans halophyticus TaxID=1262583 RepID=A0A4V2STC2_9PSEU|nr:iron-sulfur cluster biosynthesis family protein [Tamaricihabitans halophyticus]TCP50116.1 Fe-S cluster assembly iron-binding protein IscA [Tamaricihabitans halophyticus]
MLALTDAAADAITALTTQEGQQDNGGLRFSVQEDEQSGAALALTLAEQPESGDEVVKAEDGARVFLEAQAAELLSDKVLDVQPDDEGQLNFAIRDQD